MLPQRGFTLLEVMVSVFLLALALLGLDAMQVAALRQSRGDDYFQQALLQANNMAEYLRAHHGENELYLTVWQQQLQHALPVGTGSVTSINSAYQITIQWGEAKRPCQHSQPGISGCVIQSVHL